MDTIPLVASNYRVRRYTLTDTSAGWQQICPANPSRWSLRILLSRGSEIDASPFPGDPDFRGYRLTPTHELELYFAREPGLTGLAWFIFSEAVIFPANLIEAWETCLSGT